MACCLLARMENTAGTAITHAAAKHINGVSLHTGLKLGKVDIGVALPPKRKFWEKRLGPAMVKKLNETSMLIIDEIFMAHANWL